MAADNLRTLGSVCMYRCIACASADGVVVLTVAADGGAAELEGADEVSEEEGGAYDVSDAELEDDDEEQQQQSDDYEQREAVQIMLCCVGVLCYIAAVSRMLHAGCTYGGQ